MTVVRSLLGLTVVLLASTGDAFVAPGSTLAISCRRSVTSNTVGGCSQCSSPQILSQSAPQLGGSALSKGIGGAYVSGAAAMSRWSPEAGGYSPTSWALKAASSDAGIGGDGEGDPKDLSGLRRAALLAVWLPFVAYAFGPWSPGLAGDPRDIELVKQIIDSASAEAAQTAIFFAIFNVLGVLPAVFASILCGGGAFKKGRQPVPPQPFVFGAFVLGFFSIAPYLALRNYLPGMDPEGEEASLLEKVLTSKITALLLLAGNVYCFWSLPAALSDPAAVTGFSELFWSSKLVHVSTLDAIVLSVAIVDALREDMRRRGWEPEAAKVALFSLPFAGPALWLLVRPPVKGRE